jgi:hypothetical protein
LALVFGDDWSSQPQVRYLSRWIDLNLLLAGAQYVDGAWQATYFSDEEMISVSFDDKERAR